MWPTSVNIVPMPSAKRKADAQYPIETKKIKLEMPMQAQPKQSSKLPPLGQRQIYRAPTSYHTRRKNGSCYRNCQICKEEEYAWDALNNPDATFHELHVCRAKGREGSPTYDKAGYELDYDKVMDWFRPAGIPSRPTALRLGIQVRYFADRRSIDQQMLDEFFEEGAAPRADARDFPPMTIAAVKARVEADTGVLFHRIGPYEVRDWAAMGFPRAKEGWYNGLSDGYKKWCADKEVGSALRK